MIRVLAPVGYDRGDDAWEAFQQFVVARSVTLPRCVPGVQVPELDAQHGRQDFVEPAVPALLRADVWASLPVVAQYPQPRG